MFKQIIVPAISSVLTAVIFWFAVVVGKLPQEIRIPKRTVIAINDNECPGGWKPYLPAQGRFVIGMINEKKDGLGPLALGQFGGSDEIRIDIESMPPHSHVTLLAVDPKGDYMSGWAKGPQRDALSGSAIVRSGTTSKTSEEGGNKRIPTVPPFVALRYCEKK